MFTILELEKQRLESRKQNDFKVCFLCSIEVNQSVKVPLKELYNNYVVFCEIVDLMPWKKNVFSAHLMAFCRFEEDIPMTAKKQSVGVFYNGISLDKKASYEFLHSLNEQKYL